MRKVVHIARYKRDPRGRLNAAPCNFVVLTINQCKAHANIYFHQFNSEIYIWRLSRVVFSWFTAVAMSGNPLIFRIRLPCIRLGCKVTRTPYITLLAIFDPPCWLLWTRFSLSLCYISLLLRQPALIALLLQMGVNWILLTRTNSIALLR